MFSGVSTTFGFNQH